MRQAVILLFALFALPCAQAQTVQKCVARDGQARYQSGPCERGMRTAEAWDAVPEPEPVRSVRAVPDYAPRRARRSRRPFRVSRARLDASIPATESCEQARAYRDDAERRAGLARNYELLSTLQRRVYDACK